jgi:LPS-assembly protein
MFRCFLLLAACISIDLLWPADASAQSDLSSCKIYSGDAGRAEQLEDVRKFYGSEEQPARILCDELQFFADYAELFMKEDRLTARGHVVFSSQGNRIWADRMEFNTRTRTGVFYNARGSTLLGDRGEATDRSLFGTQEPEAAFWGERLEKLGPKKYRITRGGFTTCVQPTPRWELVAGTVTLNLDDYALLTNSLFRVKGVPLMYLPVFYYPIQDDGRATGFLIPTYGTSTFKGQILSNAFFWAIGRSHDATIYHDWMTKAGHQLGGDYRYVLGAGSQGNSRFSLINEKPVTTTGVDGVARTTAGTRSYSFGGDFTQKLPGTFSLRGSADYFSSIVTQQALQQDLTRATNRNRRFGTFATGTLAGYQISASVDRNDYFYTATQLTTYGTMPRVNVSRPERPIAGSPVYFGVAGEYVSLLRSSEKDQVKTEDRGLTRFDIAPTVRVPFNRWAFLGINTSFGWHGTYWTESLEDKAAPQAQIEEGIARQYVDFTVRATGPVFNRIFNPPEGREGRKYKHVIQPSFTMQYISPTQDVFDRIVRLESIDSVVGGTRYTYDLTNRLYAKKDIAREVLSVSLNQTYYTNDIASKYDPRYQSSFVVESQQKNSNFSPVAFQVRASPTDRIQGDFRSEWDPKASAITTISANGTFSSGDWLNGSAGWSQRRFIQDFPGFDDPDRADQYINAVVNIRRFGNRIGGSYTFNYDILRDRFLNQRWVSYYNAQCCGVGIEYQTFNLQGSLVPTAVPQDRRFNISFTLAGIGTFSNLFGAFGGQQSR